MSVAKRKRDGDATPTGKKKVKAEPESEDPKAEASLEVLRHQHSAMVRKVRIKNRRLREFKDTVASASQRERSLEATLAIVNRQWDQLNQDLQYLLQRLPAAAKPVSSKKRPLLDVLSLPAIPAVKDEKDTKSGAASASADDLEHQLTANSQWSKSAVTALVSVVEAQRDEQLNLSALLIQKASEIPESTVVSELRHNSERYRLEAERLKIVAEEAHIACRSQTELAAKANQKLASLTAKYNELEARSQKTGDEFDKTLNKLSRVQSGVAAVPIIPKTALSSTSVPESGTPTGGALSSSSSIAAAGRSTPTAPSSSPTNSFPSATGAGAVLPSPIARSSSNSAAMTNGNSYDSKEIASAAAAANANALAAASAALSEELSDWKSQAEDRKKVIDELNRDIKDLRAKNAQLETSGPSEDQVRESRMFRHLSRDMEMKIKDWDDQRARIVRLSAELNDLRSSRQRDLVSFENYEKQTQNRIAARESEYEAKLTKLQEQLTATMRERDRAEAKLNVQTANSPGGTAGTSSVASIQQTETKLRAQLKEYDATMKATFLQLNALKEKEAASTGAPDPHRSIPALAKKVRSLEKELEIAKQQLTALETKSDSRDVAVLKSSELKHALELIELRKQIATFQADHGRDEKSSSAELARVRVELEQQKSINSALLSETEEMQRGIEEMTQQNGRLLSTANEQEVSNARLVADRLKYSQNQNSLKTERDMISSRLLAANDKNAAQQRVVAAADEKLKHATDALARAKQLVKDTEEKLSGDIKQLQAEIVRLKSAKEDSADMRIEIDKLRKRMESDAKTADARERKMQETKELYEQLSRKQAKIKKQSSTAAAAAATAAAPGTAANESIAETELRILKDRVYCGVCRVRIKETVVRQCAHAFCDECLGDSLKSRNRKCPACGIKFMPGDTFKVRLDAS